MLAADETRELVGEVKRPLALDCAQHRISCTLKADEEGVPLCLDHVAAARREGGAQQPAVLLKDLGGAVVTQCLEQRCGPLDVGEEEGVGLSHGSPSRAGAGAAPGAAPP